MVNEAADIVVGIDIGTSKVSTVIGRIGSMDQIQILGRGTAECSGIKKGCIIDYDSIADSIRRSASQAEDLSGFKIVSAYINLHSRHLTSINERLQIYLRPAKRPVSQADIDKLLYKSYRKAVPEGKCIIDIIPGKYSVDDMDNISDPTGMTGSSLSVDAEIIFADVEIINSIVKSMELSEIKVDGFVVEGLASGLIVLTPEEQESTVLVIDVGGDMTDISLMRENRLLFYSSIPVGGEHITNDISIGLDIARDEAEMVKKRYNLALSSLIDNDQDIIAKDKNMKNIKGVKVSNLVYIIEARVNEVFLLCRDELEKSGVRSSMPSRMVLTGRGISFFDGAQQLAEEVFNIPVRVSLSSGRDGIKLEHSVAAGIIKYISKAGSLTGDMVKAEVLQEDKKPRQHRSSLMDKISQLFGNLF